LKRLIFKRKKGFADLSLGLIYNSKALPQPPSRDTIPLSRLPPPPAFPLCKGCGPIELVISAASPSKEICGGGQIVLQIFPTIILMRALSIVHESTGRSFTKKFYPMRFLCSSKDRCLRKKTLQRHLAEPWRITKLNIK
jgi:hypothetical protein